jgi:leader peptidase (prepilin peptidase)/N-methyltransferase
MILILGTIFAGLLGLAFGSFLNVCLSRWPEGESIALPRSHCRQCGRTLTWWENIPLLSWLALRGRCRTCRAWIGWRYPLVELAVGLLWLECWLRFAWPAILDASTPALAFGTVEAIGCAVFLWILVGLAVLDAEHFWLPDIVTLPAIVLGAVFWVLRARFKYPIPDHPQSILKLLGGFSLAVVLAAGLILLIRWVYWLVRRREGIGLGDAKLMALLAAWLGLPGALLAFGLGVLLGALAAVILLVVLSMRRDSGSWAMSKLPLGTFLCIGGIVSSLWGEQLIAAYLRWAGF